MKRVKFLVAVMALAGAASLQAAEGPAAKPGGAPGQPAPGAGEKVVIKVGEGAAGGVVYNAWGGKSAAEYYIESTDKMVQLTEDQKKAITKIIEARDKALKDFQTQNAEKLKAFSNTMMEAYKKQDKDAIAKAQKGYQEMYAPMHEAMKKSQQELENVLTPEQKAKQQDYQAAAWVKSTTDPVQLTDEQLKKAKAAYREAMGGQDRENMGRKLSEITQNILTPEQQAQIYKHRASTYVKSMFAPVKLTPEQSKQVEAAIEALGKEQGFKFDWSMYQKLSEKINAILTNEQKETLQKARSGAQRPGAAVNPAPAATAPANPPAGTNPAPATGAPANPPAGAPRPAGEKQPGVKVTQLPGGGIQVILSEGGEAPRLVQMAPAEAMKSAKAQMTQRIKRQHELIEKASQLAQKLEAVGEGKPGEAHELWEKLEAVEGELRRTFEATAPQVRMLMPGSPLPGQPAQVLYATPGGVSATPLNAPNREALEQRLRALKEKAEQASKAGQAGQAERLKHEALELKESLERLSKQPAQWQPLTGQPVNVRPDPAVQELRTQVKELSRQMEELKALIKKTAEKK